MKLEAERLILRPWRLSDAGALYRYARSERVGPRAGWPVHTSVEMSAEVIRTVFSEPETWAVVLKGSDEPIGCVGLVPVAAQNYPGIGPGEREVGYWLGEEHWGRGYIPEAVERLVARCREELSVGRLWITLSEGNLNSRRVAEKCGFTLCDTVDGPDGGRTSVFRRDLR